MKKREEEYSGSERRQHNGSVVANAERYVVDVVHTDYLFHIGAHQLVQHRGSVPATLQGVHLHAHAVEVCDAFSLLAHQLLCLLGQVPRLLRQCEGHLCGQVLRGIFTILKRRT